MRTNSNRRAASGLAARPLFSAYGRSNGAACSSVRGSGMMRKQYRNDRMALVRTYGKYGSRMVKGQKWLSPDVGRKHLFSSSDSANASLSSSKDISDESFVIGRKRPSSALCRASSGKVVKKCVGKKTNTGSQKRKVYFFRKRVNMHSRHHDPSSTEGESRDDDIFAEGKENHYPLSTREEQIPTTSQSKFVTYRRKLRSHKITSNTPFQMREKEFLGRSVETSETSICFDKPKVFRNSSKTSYPDLNPRFIKKLGRAPLQTSTPSCTRKIKMEQPSRCIISFICENEDDCMWKNNEPWIDHPSVVEINCSQPSNTSYKKLASTEFSHHSDAFGLSGQKLDGVCGFEIDHRTMASVENFKHEDAVASHSFQVQQDQRHQTLHNSFNSKELFSDDFEVSHLSPTSDLLHETNDHKIVVRDPLAKSVLPKSTLNFDFVIKEKDHKFENRASNWCFQPVVQLGSFSVQNYLNKCRSLTSKPDSSEESSFQDTDGKKQQIMNNLHVKFTPQKRLVKPLGHASQPVVLLNRLELQQHFPHMGSLIRNPLNPSPSNGTFDENKCSCQMLGKEYKCTHCKNLKSSPSTVHLNLQVDQMSGDPMQDESHKIPFVDTNTLEHKIGSRNERTTFKENVHQMKTTIPTDQKNLVNILTSNITRKRSSYPESKLQKSINPISTSVKSAEKSSLDILEHPLTQTKEEKALRSTFRNLSVSTPLGSRSWSRFKAAHSLHKKKKVITPLKSDQSILELASPLRNVNSNNQSGLLAPQDEVLMENFSATSICNGKTNSLFFTCSLEKLSTALFQSVILTDEEKVYNECHQNGPISFKECMPIAKHRKCQKIGEGVFGEVFQTTNYDGNDMVFKIIPIEGENSVNGEPQKKFEEILPEIIISKKLSQLSEGSENSTDGFIYVHSVHCVKDSYPQELLEAWDKYNRTKVSENDRPDELQNEQLYIIFVFEYGGCDLENMKTKIPSLEEARSILHQVTASLAVAETSLHFEHRDLHWGNVLVKKTGVKKVEYKLRGNTFKINTHGYTARIIDYTLSRMGEDIVHFCDLSSEESFFQGQGDYQFDIYRKMKEVNLNNWTDYNPRTNVLWLHYLADKMLNMRYKKRATKAVKMLKKLFEGFMLECLEYPNAACLLLSSPLFQQN
ncbi:uncharacterized protein haspin isoform X2 [Narcine bancroftii]|uniref:uncharacterized protein haspin isoform X2 n=1 Tax=Narcine bancroftii TaxID=1343680 RepID=UPI00383204D5